MSVAPEPRADELVTIYLAQLLVLDRREVDDLMREMERVKRYVAVAHPELALLLDRPKEGRYERLDYTRRADFVRAALDALGIQLGVECDLTNEHAGRYWRFCEDNETAYRNAFGTNPPSRPGARRSLLSALRNHGARVETRSRGPRGDRQRVNRVEWLEPEITVPLVLRLTSKAYFDDGWRFVEHAATLRAEEIGREIQAGNVYAPRLRSAPPPHLETPGEHVVCLTRIAVDHERLEVRFKTTDGEERCWSTSTSNRLLAFDAGRQLVRLTGCTSPEDLGKCLADAEYVGRAVCLSIRLDRGRLVRMTWRKPPQTSPNLGGLTPVPFL